MDAKCGTKLLNHSMQISSCKCALVDEHRKISVLSDAETPDSQLHVNWIKLNNKKHLPRLVDLFSSTITWRPLIKIGDA